MDTITRIVGAQHIERYEGPSWLVVPSYPVARNLPERLYAQYRAGFLRVIETTIMGWGNYNVIVRVETPAGPLDPDTIDGDYLADCRGIGTDPITGAVRWGR